MEKRESLREALSGCQVVVLCATYAEATPLLQALAETQHFDVATKPVAVGGVASEGEGASPVRVAVAISGCDKANAAHTLTCLLETADVAPLLVLQVGIAGAFPSPAETAARQADMTDAGGGQYTMTRVQRVTGSQPAAGPQPGDVVIATQEIYGDTGSSSLGGWLSADELGLPLGGAPGREVGNVFDLDPGLVEAAWALVADGLAGRRVVPGPCVTVSRISGLRSEGEELRARWGALAESMEGAAAAHICALYEVPFLEVRGVSNLVVDRDRSSWNIEEAVAAAGEAALLLCRRLGSLPLGRTAAVGGA